MDVIRHNHDAVNPGLQDAARAVLEARGVAWTELRATVFSALAGFARPVSAYDIAEQASALIGRRIAANSVYRILDLFVNESVAKRVESRNAFVVSLHPDCPHDCIFLICEKCGRIEHRDDDRLAAAMRSLAEQQGYKPRRPVLEVIGLCPDCDNRA